MSPQTSETQLTWNLALLTLVAGIGGTFQYGLHLSIINSPAEHIQHFVNQTWKERHGSHFSPDVITLLWSFIVSVYCVGGLPGALVAGPLCVRYGRKKTLLYNNLVALPASALMAMSRTVGSYELIFLGRILYGFNAGLGLNVHMMYIGECAPQKFRGMIAVTASFFITAGKLTGLALGLSDFLASDAAWPLLMAGSAIPALVQLGTLPFFPESPRYLLMDRQDKEGCMRAIRQLWAERNHTAEMETMMAEQSAIKGEESKSVLDLLRDRAVRGQLLVLVLVCGGLQFSGCNVVYFYAYDIFRNVGIPAGQIRYVSLGLGLTELLTIIICACVIDRVGRRTLLLVAYGLMAVTLGLLTVTLTLQESFFWMPYVATFLVFLFILGFGIGPAAVTSPLPTEIFLQSFRPAAFTLSGIMNWVGMFALGLGFPFLVEGLQTYCFLLFLVYCLTMTFFIWFFMPETKDKTMLEIMEAFQQINFRDQRQKAQEQGKFTVLATKL